MNIFNYKIRTNKSPAKCGIEVHRGNQSSVVIVTELADNEGMSICNGFEELLPAVAIAYNLDPGRLLWIEHWEAWKHSEGAPYDREKEEWIKVEFDWNGRVATSPHWIPVTASFVEAAKSVL